MTAADLISGLPDGVIVRWSDHRVRVEGPPDRLTLELMEKLRAHRADLIAFLAPGCPSDPRPDLASDAHLWAVLLRLAWDRDGNDRYGLFGSLLGMRCIGAELIPTDARTLRLQARIGSPGDPPRWVTGDEYREERTRWLAPHRETLMTLLGAAWKASTIREVQGLDSALSRAS